MPFAVTLGLRYGAALCAFMTALIVASLRHNPLVWARSSPPSVRARLEPVDERTRRARAGWGAVMTVGLVAIFGALAREAWPRGAATTYLAALVCFELFNLFDAVAIDVPLVLLEPAWAMPAATRGDPAYRDVRWHVTNFLKGAVGGLVFAALVTGATALVALAAARLG